MGNVTLEESDFNNSILAVNMSPRMAIQTKNKV